MSVSIEGFLLYQWCMSFPVLYSVARICGRVNWARMAMALALGSIYSLIMNLPGCALLNAIPLRMCMCAASIFIAAGTKDFTDNMRACIWFIITAAIMGGTALLQRETAGAWAAPQMVSSCIAGGGLVLAHQRFRRNNATAGALEISCKGVKVKLSAFMDTGNMLTESISGLPVIIADFNKLRMCLPEDFRPKDISTLPDGFRLIPVKTVTGGGYLMGFRPDECTMHSGGKVRRFDAYIALSDNLQLKGYDALVGM